MLLNSSYAAISTEYTVPIANPLSLNDVPGPGESTYEYALLVPFSLNLILYPLSVASDTADQDKSIYALKPIVAPEELSIPGVAIPDVGAVGPVLSTVTGASGTTSFGTQY